MMRAVRGMKDILPPETSRWQWVEQVARKVFELYGYQEMRLPLLERTELFARSIGLDTDIVAKEMYTFTDYHGDSLTLRPEATAQVVRAFLENRLDKGVGIKKYFLMGPMFRYERSQRGRYRQFHQINCEALGSDAPELDAEVVFMLMDLLGQLGLKELRLLINTLGCPECTVDFKAMLKQYLEDREGWCQDCQRRRVTNPLRVLDCKSNNCQELLTRAPVIEDSLCEACDVHYRRVLGLLNQADIAYEKHPRLVRGLDYYTRTAFEVTASGLGAQNAVAGGGRYNGLVKDLGGPDIPGIGFAIGEDRLIDILTYKKAKKKRSIFILPLNIEAKDKAFNILRNLRKNQLISEMNFDEKRSIRSQISMADRLKASLVIIIGENELIKNEATVRFMNNGKEFFIKFDNLAKTLSEVIKIDTWDDNKLSMWKSHWNVIEKESQGV